MLLEIIKNYQLIDYLNEMSPIKYYEFLIGVIVLCILPLKKIYNKLLAINIAIYVVNELVSNYFISQSNKINNYYNNILYDISISTSFIIWLFIFYQLNISRKLIPYLIFLFLFFIGSILILFGIDNGPNLIFPLGSLIYIILYFKDCFDKLKNEEFDYFFGNEFILISSPLLMFFGISMLFSFVSGKLQYTKIFDQYLIIILGSYVNSITYSLYLIYAYREYKLYKIEKKNHD